MAPMDARKKLEQIRRNKGKNKDTNKIAKVKDLRQLIVKKNKTKGNDRVASGRVTKNDQRAPRDLRETNKKLASRRISNSRDNRSLNRSDRLVGPAQGASRTLASKTSRRSINNGPRKQVQQQYYIPPHLQQAQPTYIIAPAAPQSNLAMDNVPEAQGTSILICNLIPTINLSNIIELFGHIGEMNAVNMINQTTAMVTYKKSNDAVRAIKEYHNRLLDGEPMLVYMMPNSSPASNVRSRIGHASVLSSYPTAVELPYGGRRI